jgi:serine/threonine protein kinase
MSLLGEALQRPQPEREAYLRRACGSRDDLFHEVWQRVLSAEKMGSFLLTPLVTAERLEVEGEFAQDTKLADRFRIVRTVAQGGMGIVYEAWDERLDKRVAVKCARSAYRRRIPPEVRNATEITHPNICRVFELYTIRLHDEEVDFLTMEFLEGPTLADRLAQRPLSRTEARDIARQLCHGLAEAHRRHVVHGDLKANNVILCGNASGQPRVVITDFGLARAMTSAQTTGAMDVGGAPDYMAP